MKTWRFPSQVGPPRPRGLVPGWRGLERRRVQLGCLSRVAVTLYEAPTAERGAPSLMF